MDIEEFGNKLFGEEPRDVKSIKVEFEGFGVKELFENLLFRIVSLTNNETAPAFIDEKFSL